MKNQTLENKAFHRITFKVKYYKYLGFIDIGLKKKFEVPA